MSAEYFLLPVTKAVRAGDSDTRAALQRLLRRHVCWRHFHSSLHCFSLCQPVMLCQGELIITDAERHNYFPILFGLLIRSFVQSNQNGLAIRLSPKSPWEGGSNRRRVCTSWSSGVPLFNLPPPPPPETSEPKIISDSSLAALDMSWYPSWSNHRQQFAVNRGPIEGQPDVNFKSSPLGISLNITHRIVDYQFGSSCICAISFVSLL